MANNRMYLVNERTGDRIYLAKYYPSTGWFVPDNIQDPNDVFDRADFGHLSPEQRAENAQHRGLGAPHPSAGGMYGAEWRLEYEVPPEEGEK